MRLANALCRFAEMAASPPGAADRPPHEPAPDQPLTLGLA
jgi:hypothetical protein